MAVTEYTYVISTDTANGAVHLDKLNEEIAADPAITIARDSSLINGDSLSMFMKAALSVSEESALDAVVAAHDGQAPANYTPINELGIPIVAPTFEHDENLSLVWKGKLYTATAGVTNIFDELVTTEIKLRGGWYELMGNPASPNAVLGDYLEFAVVDKDDALGLFAAYGLTVGVHVLELSKFVIQDFVNPFSNGREEFQEKGASNVVAGLYLRTIYHSEGSEDVKFKRVVQFYE